MMTYYVHNININKMDYNINKMDYKAFSSWEFFNFFIKLPAEFIIYLILT